INILKYIYYFFPHYFILICFRNFNKIHLNVFCEVTIHQGGQVHLECQADGVPAPLLSWVLPNRSTLTSSGTFSNRIHMDTNGTLHISVTLPTDQGVYRCVASNSAGAASASVRLHVSLLPPVIQQPREEHLLFSVGWPVYAHYGTLVRPSQFLNGNLFVLSNGTLHIRNVGSKDTGNYECTANNAVGTTKRTNQAVVFVDINVIVRHTFFQVIGETATIPCRTTGDPAPTVTWFSPSFIIIPQNLGSGLSSQRVVAISDGTLEVSSAQKIDSGNYTCRASNSAGIRSMVVTLEVETSSSGVIAQVEKGQGWIAICRSFSLLQDIKQVLFKTISI
uniref:Ig-like domain-containing protein n=1 Tax=Xiphophorus couchianus TaxID=32473 RepID=A0A3B5KVA1_9TELE